MSWTMPDEFTAHRASRWFVRLRSKDVTARTDTVFRGWLEADQRHEREFQRTELVWELASELEEDAEIAALIHATKARVVARRVAARQRSRLTWQAVTVAIVFAAAIGLWLAKTPPMESTFVTQIGEQRQVGLPDGSTALMNTGTRLRVNFSRERRKVYLEQGEATFAVRHDAGRPFEVISGGVIARDLGTRFNVLNVNGGDIEVAVVEGEVRMQADAANSPGRAAAVLEAGQAARYTRERGLSSVEAADLRRIEGWHEHRIVFNDIPLGQAIEEYNRYTATPLVIVTPALNKLRISASVRVGDVEAFTNALHQTFHLEQERQNGTIRLTSPDKSRITAAENP